MALDSGCGTGLDTFLRSSGVRSGGPDFELGRSGCVPIQHGVFCGWVFGSVAVIIMAAGDSVVAAAVWIQCQVAVAHSVS